MRIRSAGIAALVAAVGIWMSFPAEPAMAAKSAKAAAKSASKTSKANARAGKPAVKSSVAAADRPMVLSKFKKQRRAQAGKKARTVQKHHARKSAAKITPKIVARITDKNENESGTIARELPPSVANARAQALADDQARNIAALDSTDVPVMDGVQIATADQPNSADSAPPDAAQNPAASSPSAAAPPPQNGKIIRAVSSGEKPVLKAADDSDPWSKTSLIGKIFIAFGSLLTLASAARLLIA